MTTPELTTPLVTPITAHVPEGLTPKGNPKQPVLVTPDTWTGTISIAINETGTEFAFIANNGKPYQGVIANISPRALAFGYAFGCKQKADSDGAKDKSKTAETAESLISFPVHLVDWHAPRVSGPREETATPLSLQVKALLIAKLKTGGLGSAIKAKKIKLTGFTGGIDSLFARYAAVVLEATGMEATEAQWSSFVERTTAEATAAIAAINEDPFA